MPKKEPGKLEPPPAQVEFDRLPLKRMCVSMEGIFHRLHGENAKTGKPWPPLHFSRRGTTRFDPPEGVGTLYLGDSFTGALMELLDDSWGPVGSPGRSVTEQQLRTTWHTLVYLPPVDLLDTTGANLSKFGTTAMLHSGPYPISQLWALRFLQHPAAIAGILFRSRHDPSRRSLALFDRPALKGRTLIRNLTIGWSPKADERLKLLHGPGETLRDFAQIDDALRELQVARLP